MRVSIHHGSLLVGIAALIVGLFSTSSARAEGSYLMDGRFGLGTGFEGGDPGTGAIGWRRARLRVNMGIDLRDDEARADALGFRAFVEVQARGSFGGEVRYERWLSEKTGVFAGLTGTVAPYTLFGGGVGATVVLLPLGKASGVYVEPVFQVLPIGSDLPHGSILIWGLLSVGLQLGL
jgi:hypothetical protein